jgi:hypothetical protein
MAISSALGSSALLPAGLGFRNVLINGDFRINQRGFTSSSNPANAYGFDRWNMYSNNGTTTYSSQAFTVGNAISGYEPQNHIRLVTSGQSAANAASLIDQKIEDVRTCAGSAVVVSFYAKAASGTPKVAVELGQNFGSGGSPSSTVNSYVGQVTLTTSWQRFTLTFNVPTITGKTIGTTANTSFLVLNLWCSAGTDFNARTGSLGIQSNTFDIWGVQVEQNLQPTPFEQRPIGVELALCQRYYWRMNADATTTRFGAGYCYASNQAITFIQFPQPMRSAPTALEQSGTASHYAVLNSSGGGVPCNAVPAISTGATHSASITWTTSGSLTAGNGTIAFANSTTNAFLAWSAEL